MLLSAKEIIKNILVDCNLQIIDIFEYGTCKIEFMVARNNEIISISMVEDGSYDFMIFTSNGDALIYSNTEKLTSINQLRELVYGDLYRTGGFSSQEQR